MSAADYPSDFPGRGRRWFAVVVSGCGLFTSLAVIAGHSRWDCVGAGRSGNAWPAWIRPDAELAWMVYSVPRNVCCFHISLSVDSERRCQPPGFCSGSEQPLKRTTLHRRFSALAQNFRARQGDGGFEQQMTDAHRKLNGKRLINNRINAYTKLYSNIHKYNPSPLDPAVWVTALCAVSVRGNVSRRLFTDGPIDPVPWPRRR